MFAEFERQVWIEYYDTQYIGLFIIRIIEYIIHILNLSQIASEGDWFISLVESLEELRRVAIFYLLEVWISSVTECSVVGGKELQKKSVLRKWLLSFHHQFVRILDILIDDCKISEVRALSDIVCKINHCLLRGDLRAQIVDSQNERNQSAEFPVESENFHRCLSKVLRGCLTWQSFVDFISSDCHVVTTTWVEVVCLGWACRNSIAWSPIVIHSLLVFSFFFFWRIFIYVLVFSFCQNNYRKTLDWCLIVFFFLASHSYHIYIHCEKD